MGRGNETCGGSTDKGSDAGREWCSQGTVGKQTRRLATRYLAVAGAIAHAAAGPINASEGASDDGRLVCGPQRCAQTWHVYQGARTGSCSARHSCLVNTAFPMSCTGTRVLEMRSELSTTSAKASVSCRYVRCRATGTGTASRWCLLAQIVLVLVLEKVLSVPAEMPLRRAAVS